MTPIQEELSKIIHYLLNSTFYRENYTKHGLRDILNEAIRQFPGVNYEEMGTYKKIELYKLNHRISKRAGAILDNPQGVNNKELVKLVHYEHIEPVAVTREKLINLPENPSLEQIQEKLRDCEVIILSKEEAKVLDGKTTDEYKLDDKYVYGKGYSRSGTKSERLNSLNIEFDKRYVDNTLSNSIVENGDDKKKGKRKVSLEEKAFVKKGETVIVENLKFALLEMIDESGWFEGSKSKNFVRFTTHELDVAIPKKGTEIGFKKNESFVFEINLEKNKLAFQTSVLQGKQEIKDILNNVLLNVDGFVQPRGERRLIHYRHKFDLILDDFIDIDKDGIKEMLKADWDRITYEVEKVEKELLKHKDELMQYLG